MEETDTGVIILKLLTGVVIGYAVVFVGQRAAQIIRKLKRSSRQKRNK